MADAAKRPVLGRLFAFTGAPRIGVRVAYRQRRYHVVGWLRQNPDYDPARPPGRAQPKTGVGAGSELATSGGAAGARSRAPSEKPACRWFWGEQRSATHVLAEGVTDGTTRLLPIAGLQIVGGGSMTAVAVERCQVTAARMAGMEYA